MRKTPTSLEMEEVFILGPCSFLSQALFRPCFLSSIVWYIYFVKTWSCYVSLNVWFGLVSYSSLFSSLLVVGDVDQLPLPVTVLLNLV